jgi:tetratricopeptide (TPR) repeat protein
MKHRALPLLLMILALSAQASAQMNTPMNSGPISGTVLGEGGKPLPDTRVEVYALGTGQLVRSGYTNAAGSFELGDVAFGDYEVVAQHGISEARERVSVHGGGALLSLRMSGAAAAVADAGGKHSVSVAQLQVPRKARRYLRKAEKALHQREYQAARENVNKALAEFEKYPEALVLRGVLSLDDNQVDAAMADFQKAIEYDASCAVGYVAMAAAFNLKNQFDDAVRSAERAITLAPTNWQAFFEMGKAQIGKADYRAALQALDRAGQFVPNTYSAIHLVKAHALLGLKNYPEAMYELQAYIEREPAGPGLDNARQALEKVKAFAAKSGK